jgi:hypothetical protein
MNKIDIMNGILDAHELNFSQVVAANMVREIWEDSKRHKDDSEVNHRIVEVVKEGKITEVRCAIAELFFEGEGRVLIINTWHIAPRHTESCEPFCSSYEHFMINTYKIFLELHKFGTRRLLAKQMRAGMLEGPLCWRYCVDKEGTRSPSRSSPTLVK